MNKKALLCLDSESLSHPFLIGLPDENLEEQSWLALCCDAKKARFAVFSNKELKVVWVVSSDTIAGINLAAALRKDNPHADVYFVSFNMSGSVLSRCQAASVKTLNKSGFMKAYSLLKAEKNNPGSTNKTEQLPTMATQQFRTTISSVSDGRKNKAKFFLQGNSPEKAKELSQGVLSSEEELTLEEPPSIDSMTKASPNKTVPIRRTIEDLRLQTSSEGTNIKAPEASNQGNKTASVSSQALDKNKGFVVSVFSGSGGTGKSSVAAMLGIASVNLGCKTVVLDADFQFGDMGFLLGVDNQITVQDIYDNPARIKDLNNQDGLPSLIAPPDKLEYSEMASQIIPKILPLLQSKYEVVIINTGAFWGDSHAQLLELSDKSIFLIDQRPSSVRSCAHALSLCSRCGIATQNFLFALNKCSRQALLTSIDVSCALKGVHVYEIKDGGKEVGELLSAGLPRELARGKNPFYEGVKDFLLEMLPAEKKDKANSVNLQGKQKSHRLVRRKRRAACL